jgi:hypothetical protein
LSAFVLAGTYLLFACDLLTSFPEGWDALSYHFPVSLRLLQEGTLSIPDPKVWQLSLPANAEIGMALLLGTAYQSLAPVINWLAVVILAFATYIIGMKISGNREAAFGTTLIALSIPIVQFQTFAALIDLFGTAFLLAAVAIFLVRPPVTGPRTGWDSLTVIVLSALACGISVGSKPIYFVFGAVFFTIAVTTSVVDYKRSGKSLTQIAVLVLVLTAAVATPCVFWFARGLVTTGNPVYPLRVAVGSHVLFDGYHSEQITTQDDENNYVRSRSEWLIYPWTEWKRGRSWDQMTYGTNSGYGAAFAAFVPLGLLYAARELLRRKLGLNQSILFIAFCFLAVIWWFFLRRQPRFGLPLWVAACSLSTPLLLTLIRFDSMLFRLLFVCTVVSTCVIDSSRPAQAMLGRIRTGQHSRAGFYDYPRVIDQLPSGSRVLNYSQSYHNNFALAGVNLGTRVVPFYALPAPVNGKLDIDPSFRNHRLTDDLIRNYNADYVVEQLDDPKASPPPPSIGLFLDSDTLFTNGDDKKQSRWRIWRIMKHP